VRRYPPPTLDEVRRSLLCLRKVEAALDALVAERDALREWVVQAREALADLLDAAERIRGGDTSFNPEEWYLRRDYARITLASFDDLAAKEETP
jgi:hypothetical protein